MVMKADASMSLTVMGGDGGDKTRHDRGLQLVMGSAGE
jgi:hypothetical protein